MSTSDVVDRRKGHEGVEVFHNIDNMVNGDVFLIYFCLFKAFYSPFYPCSLKTKIVPIPASIKVNCMMLATTLTL